MRLSHLIGPEMRDLLRNNPEQIGELLEEVHPEDLADVLLELDDAEAAELLKRMEPDDAADIFERLPEGRQEALVSRLGLDQTAKIATEMAADDRADLFTALPESVGEELLETLEQFDPEAAEEVEELTQWKENTAGHLMTMDYISLSDKATAGEAIEQVRKQGEEVEIIAYVYIVNDEDSLVGVLSLRQALLADPSTPVRDIMSENLIAVNPNDDQEVVAKIMAKYDVQALPVVDENGKFLGIITVDDIIDVIREEQTEDVHKLGAVQPIEDPYFETTTWTFIKKRGVWLLLLFVGEMFTGSALRHFDHVIQSVAQLSYYVPLLISTGGNSGGQSSTLIIRGIAVGEIKGSDWYRVLSSEFVQGLVLGLILALVGIVRVYIWGDGSSFAALVALSLVGISIMGCVVGGMLPLIIKKVGLDPATSSTPFIASLVDVFGILIYFSLARVFLAKLID